MGITGDLATLYIICGLPASGKTSLAVEIKEKKNAIHLSEDEWIKDLIGKYDHDEIRENIAGLHRKFAARLLSKGINIVMDGGYFSKEERDLLRKVAKDAKSKFELHFMKTDFATINARRIARNKDLESQFWTTEENLKKAVSYFQAPDQDEKYILHKQK
jgi:predicted kinase